MYVCDVLFRLSILLLPLGSVVAQASPDGPVTLNRTAKTNAVLQPADEITIRSLQMKEVADKSFRLDSNGDVNMPLLGRVQLANLTAPEAETVLNSKFKVYYTDPDLELIVTSIHPDLVSIIGAVGNPGFHEMKNKMTLLDAISLAGGARADAGPLAIVTRQAENGAIPRPNAHWTTAGESIVELDLKGLLEGRNADENILIQPMDVVSVPSAQVVYVIGNVKHAGGFTLSGTSNLSVLQALARAEGLDPRALPEKSRILRRRGSQEEQQIPVDLKKVLAGKAEDVAMEPNDILFVPSSASKTITSKTIDAAIQVAIGLAIFVH